MLDNLNKEIIFSSNPISTTAIESSKRLKNNQILLCENIRFHPEEEELEVSGADALASKALALHVSQFIHEL